MSGLTWLHLSDWHQKEKNSDYSDEDFDRKVVLEEMIDDIKKRTDINQDLEKIDFVVFSGDVAYSGKPEEYELAKEELFDPVLKACNLKDPKRLFIVPGNHDLDRDRFYLLPEDLKSHLLSDSDVKYWLSDDERKSSSLIPLKAFTSFVSEYTKQKNPDYSNIFQDEVDGKNIALLGIDSAWMCGRRKNSKGETEDKGVVFVGEPQIYAPLKDISKFNIKIAVLHHPFDWLAQTEYNPIMVRIMEGCDIILCGHLHDPRVTVIRGTFGNCVVIPAGACYARRTYANAYNFVHLNFESKKGVAFLRRWNGTDKWRKDFDASPPEGEYEFSLPDIANRSSTLRTPIHVRHPVAMTSATAEIYLHGNKYSRIQEAVDAANPGDIISIKAGTCKENVRIDKSITIAGVGARNTIIDGGKVGSVFAIGRNNRDIDVVLLGMTIQDGNGTSVRVADNDANEYVCGGGILNYGRLTVMDSIVSSNTAYCGGGVFNKGTLNLYDRTLVAQNNAHDGGGIFNSGGVGAYALVNLNCCSINNNRADERGAGIYSAGNTVNMFPGSIISGNNAGNSGGGVYLAPAEYVMNLHGGDIFDNRATTSGGGIFSYGGKVYLIGGNIRSNTAKNGAGATNGGGWMYLNGVRIYGNTANKDNYGYGGGIQNSGPLTLNSGSIDHNTAFTRGAGISTGNDEKVIGDRSLVHDNTLINGTPDDISSSFTTLT